MQTRYELLEKGLDHARNMFIYHATQRHNSIRFFFVAVAIFLTGFFVLLTNDSECLSPATRNLLATIQSIAAFVITVCFWRLDERNVALVHSDERLLRFCEQELAILTSIPQYKTVDFSDTLTPRWLQYTWIMRLMFLTLAGLCVLGTLVSCGALSKGAAG